MLENLTARETLQRSLAWSTRAHAVHAQVAKFCLLRARLWGASLTDVQEVFPKRVQEVFPREVLQQLHYQERAPRARFSS